MMDMPIACSSRTFPCIKPHFPHVFDVYSSTTITTQLCRYSLSSFAADVVGSDSVPNRACLVQSSIQWRGSCYHASCGPFEMFQTPVVGSSCTTAQASVSSSCAPRQSSFGLRIGFSSMRVSFDIAVGRWLWAFQTCFQVYPYHRAVCIMCESCPLRQCR